MRDLSSIFLLQPDAKDALWEFYHANTKLSAHLMPRAAAQGDPVADLNASIRLTLIEEIEAAVGSGGKRYATAEKLALPDVFPEAFQKSLATVLEARASRRAFASTPLELEQLAALGRVTCGRNERRDSGTDSPVPFRFTPSAGALYPLELYLLALAPIRSVAAEPMAEIWHYEPQGHCLERIARCEPTRIEACFQSWPASPPPVVALLTGVPKRQSWKYGARAYRYTLLEAGHAAQNLILAATAMQLHACPVVSFYDDVLHDLLDVDGVSEVALYTVFIGFPPTGA